MKVKLQLLRRTLRRMALASAAVFATGLGSLQAQVYLTENFDSAFVGTPAAPPGWTQERLGVYGNVAPGALTASGIRDWQRNVNTGSGTWSLVPTTIGIVPSAAANGTGVLWFNDANANPTANFYMRRMASPTINLAAATNPYVKFSYFNANGSSGAYGVKVMASSDNGATWKLIMVVQPNAQVGNTANSATTLTSATPWQRIAVKIPTTFLTANTKIALVQNNGFSSHNTFIDSFSVEEFTPTTITSVQSGNWNDPLTWGGTVPNAENNVVISAGHTVGMNANICRAQDVTVDGTLNYSFTSTLQLGQFFGNLNIGATGLVTAGSGTTGKVIYIGGNFNNAGTANFQVSTASNLIMYGGSPATITNTGTITGGFFSVITHGNSGGITYNSPITIRNTCNLFEGNVNPNSNLTLGVTANTNTIQRSSQSQFTSAPIFASLGASARNLAYVTFANQTITQQVMVPGDEVENLSGTRTVTGTLTLNTQDRVELGFPLTVGTATTGGSTFSRGILVSTATNMLTFNLFATGGFNTAPNTATPCTTHGSYVVGPVRYNRPATGTATLNLPYGVGTDYLGFTPNDNVNKQFTVTPGGNWASQTPIIELVNTQPTGSGTGVNVLGNRYLTIDLNGGADFPTTATITFPAMNYTFGTGANTDNLFGTQDQLRVLQNTATSGTTWISRSNTTGTGALVANTNYTRTTSATAPGPIAPITTNGGVFAMGTTAAKMVYDSTLITRDITPISVGATNQMILRVAVYASGVVPITISNVTLNTIGTTNTADLLNAKLFYTGATDMFSTAVPYGTSITSPSGSMSFNGSRSLVAGVNYFWLAYDVTNTATLGNTLAANLTSITVDGNVVTPTNPAAAGRVLTSPITYVSSSATHSLLSVVGQGGVNSRILDVVVNMSATGAPIVLTQMDFNTNGSGTLSNIANAKLYYTGTSNTFGTTQLVGTTSTPNGAFTIAGTAQLNQGANHFWLTYDLTAGAIIGDSIDAELVGFTIAGNSTVNSVAPVGNRKIRQAHCFPPYSTGKTAGDLLSRVRIIGTTLDNNSGTAAVNPSYTLFTGQPNFTANLIQGSIYQVEVTIGSFQNQGVAAWMDYNDDGIFQTSERIGFTVGQINVGFGTATFPIALTCAATPGVKRLRVRCNYAMNGNAVDPCASYTWGECEDYEVNIGVNPGLYGYSTVNQISGTVAQGATTAPLLRIPVTATGCAPITIDSLNFSGLGTTNMADILSAKIYKTGNSTKFTNANLLGTINNPGSSFKIPVMDTLLNGFTDTNNYWLAVDVAPTAVVGNTIDAECTSIVVDGVNRIPVTTNPTGNLVVQPPMIYNSSLGTAFSTTKVGKGTTNNPVIKAMVITSSTGAPIVLSSISFNSNGGGIDSNNIANAKVYYTGNNPTFGVTNQFGSTFSTVGLTTSTIGTMNFNGYQQLTNDTNYFWLAYDLKANATFGDSVDAEFTGITIAGSPITFGFAPIGTRVIRDPYCLPGATAITGADIGKLSILQGTTVLMSNGVSTPLLSNPAAVGTFSDFTTLAPVTIQQGKNYTISMEQIMDGAFWNGAGMGVYVDWNDDGDYLDVNETIGTGTTQTTQLAPVLTRTLSAPCNIAPGLYRLRVVLSEFNNNPLSCAVFAQGETEEYLLNVVPGLNTAISSNAIQFSGTTSAGVTDLRVLRIPVVASISTCNAAVVTQFNFKTATTTLNSDIIAAKLYKTGTSSTFNTTNLVGTVNNPGSSFAFIVTDTANNDTNNYWLAYDVSASAPNGNFLDASLDSIQLFGSWSVPVNGDPTGNILISTPMTYLGSAAEHTVLTKMSQGSVNNVMLRVMVRCSSTGAPINLTNIDFNSIGGGSDTLNITNAKVYYTGANPNFSNTNQFGATFSTAGIPNMSIGAFGFTGSQALLNDTNYFWLTYDLKAGAVIGDSADAELVSLNVGGSLIANPIAPVGNRKIKGPYCTSNATNTADTDIGRVRLLFGNTVLYTNGSNTPIYTNPDANKLYSNFTANAPGVLQTGKTYTIAVDQITGGGTFYSAGISVYVDWNDDGDFIDVGETVHQSGASLTGNPGGTIFGGPVPVPGLSGNFTVPCNASGNYTMRVIINEGNGATASCGTYNYGETEDHTISVVPGSSNYVSSSAIQNAASAAPGASDVRVVRIPMVMSNSICNPGIATQLNFRTTGTTNNADILAAKLYKTGSSAIFSTNTLIGTVNNPGTNFSFIISDSTVNDTNNYWLAYDLSGAASNGNVVDAIIDSIQVLGAWVVPTNNNPSGAITIATPMTYLSSTSSHSNLDKVAQGDVNNEILMVRVIGSSTGAPINVTSINFNSNGGGIDTLNISNAKVYYTGASKVFAPVNQFGSTYSTTGLVTPNIGPFGFTGLQSLLNDTNYFWLTYDMKANAVIGDSVDAELLNMTIGGNNQVPTVSAPSGVRKIRAPYCNTAMHTQACNVSNTINNVSTVGGVTNISNLNSGCSPSASNVFFYADKTVTAYQGGSFDISYQSGPWQAGFGIYIDYNQDGDFTDLGEDVAFAATSNLLGTSTISIPASALTGTTRLRVRASSFGTVTSPCNNTFDGETEDYNLTILPLPPSVTYTWNQTASASFVVPTNWTPTRTIPLVNDVLVFNGGGNVTVTALPNQTVAALTVNNNTKVEFTGSSNSLNTVALNLTSGSFKTNNARINVGTDTVNLGTITGTGTVEGNLGRYVNSSTTTVNFPLSQGTNSRAVDVNYTVSPIVGGLFTASFVAGVPTTAGLPLVEGAITGNKIAREGIWRLFGPAGTYTLAANGTGFIGVFDYTTTVLARRSASFNNWTLAGTHVTTTGSNAAPVFNRSGLTVFGEFAMIADSAVNPLPVRMLSFDASNVRGDVKLTWSTSSELNNKGFEVERSVDGKRFSSIGFVKGAVNSNVVTKYNSSDNQAFSKAGVNTLYYRLKQVDMDGKVSYTDVRKVTADKLANFEVVAYPVPFDRSFNLSISSIGTSKASISIYDMQGRLVSSREEDMQEGVNTVNMHELELAKGGVYFVKVTQLGESKMVRVVKTN